MYEMFDEFDNELTDLRVGIGTDATEYKWFEFSTFVDLCVRFGTTCGERDCAFR